MKLKAPSYLKEGDTIVIVAPAGILKDKENVIASAKKLTESWGLRVLSGKHIFNQANHFAGTDKERTEDFQWALDRPEIKAIWCARGGYGSARIIDDLDFSKFIKYPKWIIGYSDITVFHNHVHNLGIETLHAMLCTSIQDNQEVILETIETFRKALFGKQLKYKITSSKYNRKGTATGQLAGGNITIMASMLGSDSQISTGGKILFIEETGEYEYAIDRMLYSLQRAGYFKNVEGVIVGNISKIKENLTVWGSPVEELILNVLPEDIPVMFDFPAGHEPDNRAIVMGRNIQLSVNDKQCSVVFNSGE